MTAQTTATLIAPSAPSARHRAEEALRLVERMDLGGDPTERYRDEVGRIVAGRYLIDDLIGHGAFGSVYRALDRSTAQPVALKLLRADLRHDSSWVGRFRREAEALSRLHHPHIVTELDFGLDAGLTFLVMELLAGRSLDEELLCRGSLGLGRTIAIVLQVCSALQATHDVGLVHRDVKPGNVYLDRRGGVETAKVLDFGIAKMIDEGAEERITVEGARLGTLEYMAPERYDDEDCTTGACDVYSLGCMLYQMLSGRLPFTARKMDLLGLARQHLLSVPTSLRDYVPDVPREVDDLVLQTLEKCPSARPSAAELGRALAAVPVS